MTIPANNVGIGMYRPQNNRSPTTTAQSLPADMAEAFGTYNMGLTLNQAGRYVGLLKYSPTYGYGDVLNVYGNVGRHGNCNIVAADWSGRTTPTWGANWLLGRTGGALTDALYSVHSKNNIPADFGNAYTGELTIELFLYCRRGSRGVLAGVRSNTSGTISTSTGNAHVLRDFGGAGDSFINFYEYKSYNSNTGRSWGGSYAIVTINGTQVIYFEMEYYDGPTRRTAGGLISETALNHIALVRQGNTFYLYVNGIFTGSGAYAGQCSVPQITFGHGVPNLTPEIRTNRDGVEEIRIARRALYPNGTNFTPPSTEWF